MKGSCRPRCVLRQETRLRSRHKTMGARAALVLCALLGSSVHAASPPEQVHMNLGVGADELIVQWVTQEASQDDVVVWGTAADALTSKAVGDARAFTQDPGRTWYTHTATMAGLKPDTTYYYRVGDAVNGMSAVFETLHRRTATVDKPYRHILLGDMGSACAFTLCRACNANSEVCDAATCAGNTTVGLVSEVATADMYLHVGDFAYDLGSNGGKTGDQFFRNIEQLATRVPYMVSHGNHEDSAIHLSHYCERFRGMPSNAEPATFTSANGETTNTMYFSWDHGLVHWIALSTELWFGVGDDHVHLEQALTWLRADLEKANANRDAVPWVVVHGHRSMYCSCDGDCDGPARTVRKDLEGILFDYGVDFFINGHEHNYERMWPTYQSKSDHSNVDMKAPVYIVTGAAGSKELHEPFTRPQPSWSAFRANQFSYTRMIVHNASHIHWQQVQTDPTTFPVTGSEYGKVIDDVWYVQSQHGPFNAATAPQEKPATCGGCKEYDHWRPLLGLEDGSGRPTLALIEDYRAAHGEAAWVAKLNALMAGMHSNLTRWEDVREDGNSDGATFKWRDNQA